MIDTADRTVELMNEYYQTMPAQSWHTLQHFLVVKIMRLEAEVGALNLVLDHVVEELDWAKYDIEDVARFVYEEAIDGTLSREA